MQPVDVVNYATQSNNDPANAHLERLWNTYGQQIGIDKKSFLELAMSHQTQGSQLPYLSAAFNGDEASIQNSKDNMDELNSLNNLNEPMKFVFENNLNSPGMYQGDVNSQIAQQELEEAQNNRNDEARRDQAIAESQRRTNELAPQTTMDESAFSNQMIRQAIFSPKGKPLQPLAVMQATAQKAKARQVLMGKLRMPATPGTPGKPGGRG